MRWKAVSKAATVAVATGAWAPPPRSRPSLLRELAEVDAAAAAAAEALAVTQRQARAQRQWRAVAKTATVAVATGSWAPPQRPAPLTEIAALLRDAQLLSAEVGALQLRRAWRGEEAPPLRGSSRPRRHEPRRSSGERGETPDSARAFAAELNGRGDAWEGQQALQRGSASPQPAGAAWRPTGTGTPSAAAARRVLPGWDSRVQRLRARLDGPAAAAEDGYDEDGGSPRGAGRQSASPPPGAAAVAWGEAASARRQPPLRHGGHETGRAPSTSSSAPWAPPPLLVAPRSTRQLFGDSPPLQPLASPTPGLRSPQLHVQQHVALRMPSSRRLHQPVARSDRSSSASAVAPLHPLSPQHLRGGGGSPSLLRLEGGEGPEGLLQDLLVDEEGGGAAGDALRRSPPARAASSSRHTIETRGGRAASNASAGGGAPPLQFLLRASPAAVGPASPLLQSLGTARRAPSASSPALLAHSTAGGGGAAGGVREWSAGLAWLLDGSDAEPPEQLQLPPADAGAGGRSSGGAHASPYPRSTSSTGSAGGGVGATAPLRRTVASGSATPSALKVRPPPSSPRGPLPHAPRAPPPSPPRSPRSSRASRWSARATASARSRNRTTRARRQRSRAAATASSRQRPTTRPPPLRQPRRREPPRCPRLCAYSRGDRTTLLQ